MQNEACDVLTERVFVNVFSLKRESFDCSAAFYAHKLSAVALCYHVNGARVVVMGKRKYVVESWSG